MWRDRQILPVEGVPEAIRIATGEDGPEVVIFGGMHGNEPCGIHAIERLAFDFMSGELRLLKGALTLARGNPEAIRVKKRCVHTDLNRLFHLPEGDERHRRVEMRRCLELRTVLDGANYFLSLHSSRSRTPQPLLITDTADAEFFGRFGIHDIVVGWDALDTDGCEGTDEQYARSRGAVSATLEAGSHDDPEALEVSYRCCLQLLVQSGVLKYPGIVPRKKPQFYSLHKVVAAHRISHAPFVWRNGPPTNLELLQNDVPFATENGVPVKVQKDAMRLLFPVTRPELLDAGECPFLLCEEIFSA